MKRLPIILFFSLFTLILSATLQDNQAVERETVTTQALRNQMNQINSRDWIRINIAMRNQIDRPALGREVSTMGQQERRKAVVDVLKSFTEKDQEGLLQFLRERER
ncbi:hypothetical protein IIA15_10585 [candidate division TA06 bacterium]|nr:hypothetical protein [candidate division TA06 bacterium]